VKAGAIGKVIQTVGLGPHRIHPPERPEWFWDTANYGGIITDIASHQFDQFLYFTGSTTGEVVASQVRNVRHPEHPKFEDFGDVMIRGNGGTGYIRVDWFTPAACRFGATAVSRSSAPMATSSFASTWTSAAQRPEATTSFSSTGKACRASTARVSRSRMDASSLTMC